MSSNNNSDNNRTDDGINNSKHNININNNGDDDGSGNDNCIDSSNISSIICDAPRTIIEGLCGLFMNDTMLYNIFEVHKNTFVQMS